MSNELKLPVTSVFQVSHRGTVLRGIIETGSVRIGQKIVVRSPKGEAYGVVAGLEIPRKLVSSATVGEDVGVLVKPFDMAAISDGIAQSESGDPSKAVVTLTLSSISSPRWKFWA